MSLKQVISQIRAKRILVVGDLMQDRYTIGRVKRISPEAPVPILQVEHEYVLPGGTGNVMVNLAALGMEVHGFSRVGEDEEGQECLTLLREKGVIVDHILKDPIFKTPVKNRLIAENQQMVRVDYEKVKMLSLEIEAQLRAKLPMLMQQISLVVISDYAKGFCTASLIAEIIKYARSFSIPVVVDPKSRHFSHYKHATLIKPNLSEAYQAAHLSEECTLEEVAAKIFEEAQCDHLLITRSKEGISLFGPKSERHDFQSEVHEVKDVTGAGDTVCAVIAATLANGISLSVGAYLANLAAGLVVQRTGCASVTLNELMSHINNSERSITLKN